MPKRMSQWTISPNDSGRVRGVVVRLDLSMVAMSPRSMMSGESLVQCEKVSFVNFWRCLVKVEVLRNPRPRLRSSLFNVTLAGVH